MKSVIENINLAVSGLTGILVGLLGLGIVANILFGSSILIGDVVGNLSALVSSLGDQGLVGLIVLIIILSIFGVKSSK